jgi:hypothetical protein
MTRMADIRKRSKRANDGLMRRSKKPTRSPHRHDVEAHRHIECLRGFEVDDQLESSWLFHREIVWFATFDYLIHKDRSAGRLMARPTGSML